MGINIRDKVVSYDPSHEKRLDTSTSKNPTLKLIRGIKIIGVFKRVRSNDDRKDGNPLIHALKGGTAYSIHQEDVLHLSRNARKIMASLPGRFGNPDFIVPIPSSSPINQMLATRIQRVYPNKPPIAASVLRKATLREVLAKAPQAHQVDKSLKTDFTSALRILQGGDPAKPIQMKLIDKKVSHLFDPICLAGAAALPQGARVLLVDDLYSSGATVFSSIRALGNNFAKGQIAAAVLLSPI